MRLELNWKKKSLSHYLYITYYEAKIIWCITYLTHSCIWKKIVYLFVLALWQSPLTNSDGLTWERQQPLQEQCYPVLPIYATVYCLPTTIQRGLLILLRDLSQTWPEVHEIHTLFILIWRNNTFSQVSLPRGKHMELSLSWARIRPTTHTVSNTSRTDCPEDPSATSPPAYLLDPWVALRFWSIAGVTDCTGDRSHGNVQTTALLPAVEYEVAQTLSALWQIHCISLQNMSVCALAVKWCGGGGCRDKEFIYMGIHSANN